MTKKPSEKNKAWEKDRRDRLNKTFDELAKLLPKYDASVVWSKIEIIQKAITFITDLQKKQEDYLKTKDPELLKEYEEFVNCLRFYQERNAQLTVLLKKAKVTLPPVVLPQLLVDKPQLAPKVDDDEVVCLQKPKRQRNRAKKSDASSKKTEECDEKRDDDEECVKSPPKPAPIEAVAKPTAVITAFSHEIPCEAPIQPPEPQLPPPAPAKPVLIRLRNRNSQRRLKLIPKTVLRKCYPHPGKVLQCRIDTAPLRKQRRAAKRKQLRKEQPTKRGKVNITPEPLREQSVSPTAAFLLSFPVVTSSMLSGKNVENAENSVSLENLNNFFTTEEYSKFCDQNPVTVDKIPTPLPVESVQKPLISGKPMTSFTVSAITRPSSPKKTLVQCEQAANKRLTEAPWVVEYKPTASLDTCYNFTSTNPMIGSTSMCSSTSQVVTAACLSSQTTSSVKLEPANVVSKSNSTGKFFPRYNHSASSPKNTTGIDSTALGSPPKAASTAKTPSITTTVAKSNPPVSTFYSPTKSFFYDFPTQVSSSPTADPLISSTAAAKSHSFLGFPSIKTEFPWLVPNTTTFTMPLPPTPTTTTCNLDTNLTPFDLASIVSDSLTSTSFTFSLSTPKSSEPTVVEAGNKQSPSNKCNQMNLFLPYEEAQYTPTFTLSLTKSTDSQAYQTARDVPWKPEKTKDISDQIFYDCEQSKPQQKPHVNWMTSPTTDYTPAPAVVPLPPIDFGNQFPITSTNFDFGFGCRKDSYEDDNQFINWSPTKPLSADFSTAYSFENFGSNEAPPNKTVKQIFSVSQLVDQTQTSSMKKTQTKIATQKSTTPVKQTFSNIYSAESLIAKKDNHRMTSVTSFYTPDVSNTQPDYHNTGNYFYNYPNTQSCSQTENDYLGASFATKTTSIQPPAAATATAPVIAPFDSTTASSTTNYFVHSISSNANDPYDPTYFPSSNYSHPATTNWKGAPVNGYNQNQLYGTGEPSCQQNPNVSGNLTNFNLSSICPEIDGKDGGPSAW